MLSKTNIKILGYFVLFYFYSFSKANYNLSSSVFES